MQLTPFSKTRQSGFTILEILIASAIMAVGMVMILGLFPFGIRVGKEVVENTTGLAIARSVADSIRSGMRNNLRQNSSRDGTTFSYFVFQHDGVNDRVPRSISLERAGHDYYILLPRYRRGRSFEGRSEAESREQAVEASTTFVYPESDPNMNGNGSPFEADDDGDDFTHSDGFQEILVSKTYQLGGAYPKDAGGREILKDHRRKRIDDETIRSNEAWGQYSYAFSIRPSYFDTNQSDSKLLFVPGNELYHVRVMVFRSFQDNFVPEKDGNPARPVQPVFELDFEVSI